MTTQPIAETFESEIIAPSTAGMTTKVVKGSLWTLLGQVLPMAVALIATPFTIRFLGSEGYGVVILVGLIPTYFSFADFGMGIASTRFASEAFGDANREREGEIVRESTLIACLASLVVAIPIFVLSSWIVDQFNVPASFQSSASVGLKISSATFVLGILASVLNTPMLSRLRMGLNSITSTVPKILMAVITPIVLYFGGGVIGAVWVGFFAGLLGVALVLFFSARLLPELLTPDVRTDYFSPLLKFGGGLVIGGIAGILLTNLEKLVLTRLVSVRSLAYYSVAYTFAVMTTLFAGAMLQSLVPAFSQLLAPEKKAEFNALFARGMRLNIIWLLPAIMVLFVIAKPFFTLWAGEDFGRESPLPFYILLFGLFFNVLAYFPHSTITAKGRTDFFAKLYWIELAIYVVAVPVLINAFGIAGAAAAWSVRVILDALIIIWFSKRIAGTTFGLFSHFRNLLLSVAVLLPAALFAAFYDNFSLWLFVIVPACLALYSIVIWKRFVEADERTWLLVRWNEMFSRSTL